MAWITTVTIDTDKTDVGTVSAVFTDSDSTTFAYSGRCHATAAERDAFIQAAIAARNTWRTLKTTDAGYVSNFNSRFVQLDI